MSVPPCMRALAVLGALVLLSGCGEQPQAVGVGESGGHKHDSPHGGVAVELGEHQYHLDFLADPEAGVLRAWVMDGHAESFVRVALRSFEVSVATGGATQTVALAAQASPASGETVGDTSQFQGEAPWLKGLTRFSASVRRIEIRGSTFNEVRFQYPVSR